TEMDALRGFLRRGGKLLLMIDPGDKVDSLPLTNLIDLAKEWGVTVDNDVIVDPYGQQILNSAAAPVATPVQHPITDRFQYLTAFLLARSVTPTEGGSNGHIAQKFLETSPVSWGETDLKTLFETRKPEKNFDKGDKAGPLAIADAVAAAAPDAPAPASPDLPKAETRVVVIGDSDFASNSLLGFQGNRDLFLNTVNWLAQQENLIAIRPKDPEDRRLTV